MKLIDKTALVAEIEKELNTTKKYSTEYVNGKKYALKKILSFLDTLEVKEAEEEPVSNDLEAEFVLYLKRKFNIPQEGHKLKTDGWRPSPYDLLDIAKHFAQWQKEQMEKGVDLEKEINRIDDSVPCRKEDIEYIAKHFFELGLKAQKGE